MFKIENTTGTVVAEDTKATIKAIDNAVIHKTRLAGTVLEACEQANLPMAQSQKLLEGMVRSLEHMVAGRADMLAVVRQLSAIKGQSTLDVFDYGCPGGLTAKLDQAQPAPVAPAHALAG